YRPCFVRKGEPPYYCRHQEQVDLAVIEIWLNESRTKQHRDDDQFSAQLKPAPEKQAARPQDHRGQSQSSADQEPQKLCRAHWKQAEWNESQSVYRGVLKRAWIVKVVDRRALGGMNAGIPVDNQIALGAERRRNSESDEIESDQYPGRRARLTTGER
ncbi:MAG: hypothetical protein WBE69_09850, partial [Candidatus Binataceae bacterium]